MSICPAESHELRQALLDEKATMKQSDSWCLPRHDANSHPCRIIDGEVSSISRKREGAKETKHREVCVSWMHCD